ncbi:unnamed protein product [Caenorhabditis bovis]|uniref:Exportin-1/Importin-beta-like domain-containing protein n=1 Tax=Caenorhabditis bovis TaxID=2654633 RepID=A0A8S1ESA1_9PELO|nr:unnamed protein product [Caenorhabditis bovis]
MNAVQPIIDGELVAAAVNEFYSTTDQLRRHALDEFLCKFRTDYDCVQTVASCIRLISTPTNNANVRYFGAACFYDVIRARNEEIVSNATLLASAKTFLIDGLTNGTQFYTQSVLNKLSSALAILTLYCIPDLWPEPVADLTAMWAPTPELLLRVLSDIAAEFQHVVMPLNQRSVLKTELHRMADDIIKIIGTVLSCDDATASTKQAALDCVEQWIRLPGIALENWSKVLSIVLEAVVKDSNSLTNLLNVLANNDDLPSMPQLLLDICSYVVLNVSSKVGEELKDDGCSDEAIALVSATCSICEAAVPTLVDVATQAKNPQILSQVLEVMQALANLPGQYPTEEKVSDLPAVFLTSLRDELKSVMNSDAKYDPQLIANIAQFYAQILHMAIFKLTYPTAEQFEGFSVEDRDLFINYRNMRSEASVDCYLLSGSNTLEFLNQKLEEALKEAHLNRSESVLFLLECVGDYLTERDYPQILRCIELIATNLKIPLTLQLNPDHCRRARTLMKLLYSLSHLVQAHDHASELEAAIFPVILSYIVKRCESNQSLCTLEKYVEDRPESLEYCGDEISQTCYDFFNDEFQPKKLRLNALKCIGYVLSRKSPQDTMVRTVLTALPDKYLPDFFPFVVNLLNSALITNASAACTLAMSTVLQCGPLVGIDMCNAICSWFNMFEQRFGDSQMDEWLSFIYQVVKKDWKTLRKHGEASMAGIQSVLNICASTIAQSQEPFVVRTAAQILACIATHTTNNDDAAMKNVLAKYGADLIKSIFARVQCELVRTTVESLAEVLFFYFQQFTTETREVINGEPYGSTPMVAALFRDIGSLRNFKQMTIRFNNAAIRDAGSAK